MAIMETQYGGYRPMWASEIREALSLPKKLPEDGGWEWQIQGYKVMLLSKPEALHRARSMGYSSSKPHRIFVMCKTCGKWWPFGRLAQHEPSCRDKANRAAAEHFKPEDWGMAAKGLTEG